MQRLFIDFHPIDAQATSQNEANPPNVEAIQAEIVILLGRHGMPAEIIPKGQKGPTILAHSTAFEFLELITKFMRGEEGAGELVALEHFLVMKPFDHTRAKVYLQYNVTMVPENNQTPSFVIPFEELAREILLFAIGVYEYVLEAYPALEQTLETLGSTIEETKTAVEQYLGIENLLNLPIEDEVKE